MRSVLLGSFLLSLLSWLPGLPDAAAQNNPQIATSQRPRDMPPPVLMVEVNDRATPLKLTKVDARVTILGQLAETELTMTFYNPNPRAMEGDLYFPLPEGATISAYALDVNGLLVEGVVVPKDQGRQIFEAEVRKGIDPGLVEWTQGNNFKTRIFPIPARGSRTVQVGYVSEVIEGKNGARFHLPLDFRDRVDLFKLRVEVIKAAAKPLIVEGGPKGLSFAGARDSYIAETTLRNAALTADLVISLPDLAKQPVRVERAPDGNVYFAIHHSLTASTAGNVRALPRRLAVYWDASLSRDKVDHKDELAVLERYLTGLGNATVRVDLVIVRNRAEQAQRFELPGQRGEILAALGRVEYDGGTQLGSLGSVADADLNLVFSDGVSNFGDEKPPRLAAPTYVINAATTANHAFLRYLAVSTGGAYFNLRRTSTDQAVAGIGQQVFSFLEAKATGAAVESLYPRLRVPVNQVFDLAGKLTSAEATITLHYGVGNQVMQRQSFTVRQSDAGTGDLLRRYWAQKKVDDLLVFAKENEQAIVDVGREHSIVTPGTSLLVLERVEQYIQYEVRPPASLPAMRSEYDQAMQQRVLLARSAETEKLAQVIAMWEEHKAWWRKQYKYPPNFRYRQEPSKTANGVEGGVVGGVLGGAAGSPAAERPSPRATSREDAADSESAPEEKAKKDASSGESSEPEPEIVLKPWTPDTPYLKALGRVAAQRRFAEYLAQRKTYGTSPAFFLDTADFFRERKNPGLALQILSNLAELQLEDPALLRVLAHRLAQLGYLDLSVQVFERVLELRREEPQSYRDLALVLAERAEKAGQGARARADYVRALELLARVVLGKWDRFEWIEVIALTELNNIWPKARQLGATKAPVDARLIEPLDMDVRIVMTWDADLTDMDLHVIEPSGEEAYYGHNLTTIGGMVSRDFTQGYGPEVYAVRRAMKGQYTVQTKFYGSSAAQLIGAVTLQVDVFTNYGRANQKRKSLTLRLTETKETFTVGSISF